MVGVEEEAGGGKAANRPETQRGRDWRKLDFIPYPRGLALVFFDAKILLYENSTVRYPVTFVSLKIMSYKVEFLVYYKSISIFITAPAMSENAACVTSIDGEPRGGHPRQVLAGPNYLFAPTDLYYPGGRIRAGLRFIRCCPTPGDPQILQ